MRARQRGGSNPPLWRPLGRLAAVGDLVRMKRSPLIWDPQVAFGGAADPAAKPLPDQDSAQQNSARRVMQLLPKK